MARPSATLLLVLSLLAVAHCRALAADHDAEPESTAAVAVSDDNGRPSNPTLPASATEEEEEALPAEQQHGLEFLRLPSHRHRPCSLHRHLWWKRHQGVDYHDAAPRRFHYSGGHGKRREALSHLAVLPEEAREAAEEVKPVAEPDPDRSLSLPDSDGGEGEEQVATRIELPVKAWKKAVLRRWFHHGMGRRHHLHHVHHADDDEGEEKEGLNMKRFRFHHHHDEEADEEKNNKARKRLRHAEHDEDSDDEDEDEQVEEMVRRFRKAIMRSRRFGHGHGHGRRFFHHHLHRHAEEAKKLQQADGEEESGVMAWIKGLMNRF